MSKYCKIDCQETSFDITGKYASLHKNQLREFDVAKHIPLKQEKQVDRNNDLDQPMYRSYLQPLQSSINADDSEKQYYLGSNSFVSSCYLAYSQHQRLVLRPDDVWIAIMTQFSFYLNANSERLRSRLVDFEGKRELTVVFESTLLSAPYDVMTLEMTNLIAKNIKDPSIRDWSMPSFSTTTYDDRIVGAICLMASAKNFFTYVYETDCGLPSVTLLGSEEDWISLKEKAKRLVEFDVGKEKLMSKWSAMLLPVLDKFIESVQKKPDLNWWNRIADHVSGGSGSTWLSGWITVFTVFSIDGKWYGDDKHQSCWSGQDFHTEWALVETNDVATGFVEVEVIIVNNLIEHNAKLIGGHYTAKIYDNNQTLVPQLNWFMATIQKKEIEERPKIIKAANNTSATNTSNPPEKQPTTNTSTSNCNIL
ncbi:hypothetical protein PPL_10192 [Heterostelium album PN500]|uniref:Uncharacterized protein n=1 Tax=Heterostelium pallidum (strain ATCC 26659 / Pp 5 / PN500) TaxID=670386 RepID=D3BQK7_HETP5|nr:hypothetical protein PPL_10192 [Heterostelium album PN500]EFA76427.1 hypothetical protein PPL_10192 [Heterostelium album PN500]|eukprot:XP_020428559.1 hypothetical protein PPL_10192 [Heterostelium album PN500]